MRVTVFGTGYVGLVTGTCLAEVGNQVVCVDIDAAKVDGLNQGVIPIYEPGLEELVLANHAGGRITFTTETSNSIDHGEVIFIAVGTPPLPSGKANLSYVETVARRELFLLEHQAMSEGASHDARGDLLRPGWFDDDGSL